ncbi:hypothetical protein MKZ38_003962 [Zalerion maritima]|uniref:Uncharacterized protein n=1 Tax=Zalerion maritima TaxID=339359 RepID=A0AAD5RND0_9PEZI|nr:hypothetical protein MKZ38_003962 [Zalerion maritima]
MKEQKRARGFYSLEIHLYKYSPARFRARASGFKNLTSDGVSLTPLIGPKACPAAVFLQEWSLTGPKDAMQKPKIPFTPTWGTSAQLLFLDSDNPFAVRDLHTSSRASMPVCTRARGRGGESSRSSSPSSTPSSPLSPALSITSLGPTHGSPLAHSASSAAKTSQLGEQRPQTINERLQREALGGAVEAQGDSDKNPVEQAREEGRVSEANSTISKPLASPMTPTPAPTQPSHRVKRKQCESDNHDNREALRKKKPRLLNAADADSQCQQVVELLVRACHLVRDPDTASILTSLSDPSIDGSQEASLIKKRTSHEELKGRLAGLHKEELQAEGVLAQEREAYGRACQRVDRFQQDNLPSAHGFDIDENDEIRSVLRSYFEKVNLARQEAERCGNLLTKDKEEAKSRMEAAARSYNKAKERHCIEKHHFQILSGSIRVTEAFEQMKAQTEALEQALKALRQAQRGQSNPCDASQQQNLSTERLANSMPVDFVLERVVPETATTRTEEWLRGNPTQSSNDISPREIIDIFGNILPLTSDANAQQGASEANLQHASLWGEEAEHAGAEIQKLKADLLRQREEAEQERERVKRRELEANLPRLQEEAEQERVKRKELEANLQREREKVESLMRSFKPDFEFTEALKELTQDFDSQKERSSSGQVAGLHLLNPVYQPHLFNLDQGQNGIPTVIPQSTVEHSYASGSREWNCWSPWGDAGFLEPRLRNY